MDFLEAGIVPRVKEPPFPTLENPQQQNVVVGMREDPELPLFGNLEALQ
jgi:hypothetical protein